MVRSTASVSSNWLVLGTAARRARHSEPRDKRGYKKASPNGLRHSIVSTRTRRLSRFLLLSYSSNVSYSNWISRTRDFERVSRSYVILALGVSILYISFGNIYYGLFSII